MWSISYTHLSNKNGEMKDWKGDTFRNKQERALFRGEECVCLLLQCVYVKTNL